MSKEKNPEFNVQDAQENQHRLIERSKGGQYVIDVKKSYEKSLSTCKTSEQLLHLESVMMNPLKKG